MAIEGAQQQAGAILALTSREAVADALRKAAANASYWIEDGVPFTPLLALHYTREEFVHRNERAHMGTDWNMLLFSATLMAAYLVWGEVYEYRMLLQFGERGHIDSFLMLADIVEKPASVFGM